MPERRLRKVWANHHLPGGRSDHIMHWRSVLEQCYKGGVCSTPAQTVALGEAT